MSFGHLIIAVAFLASATCSNVSPKLTGPDAEPNSFKWTAWIDNGGSYSCAASLIDKDWVLTAAECVNDFVQNRTSTYDFVRVHLGYFNDTTEDEQQQIRACNIIMNKKYNATSNDHNVAMLQLERSANLVRGNIEVVPAVNTAFPGTKTLKQAECYVSGYLHNNPGVVIRKNIPIQVKNPSKCSDMAGFIEDEHICFNMDDGYTENGDEGAPISCKLDGTWTQVALQLSATLSTGLQYGAYTYKNRKFITETKAQITNETCKQEEPDTGCGPAGKSFMVSFGTPDPQESRPTLFITSEYDTTVTLQPGQDIAKYFFRLEYKVTRSNGLVIPLPVQMGQRSNGVSTNSLRIFAPDDISVMAGYEPDAIGNSQIYPEECMAQFGYTYLPIGYPGGVAGLSELLIVAIQNNTQVEISAPQANTFTLNAWQVYRQDVDATGLKVTGSGPLAVFTGVWCGNVKDQGTAYCDTMYEMIQPESTLQTAYIVPTLFPRVNFLTRVLAVQATPYTVDQYSVGVAVTSGSITLTTVTSESFTLTERESKDTEYLNVDAAVVTSQYPVIVGQLGYGGDLDLLNLGDPSLLITPAIAEYTNSYYLFAPATIGYNRVAIMIAVASDTSGLRLNGAPVTGSDGNVTVSLPSGESYIVLYEPLCFGVQRIHHVNEKVRFGVVQYNQQFYRETASAPRRLYPSQPSSYPTQSILL